MKKHLFLLLFLNCFCTVVVQGKSSNLVQPDTGNPNITERVLNIELLGFQGDRIGQHIFLTWATASERATDYFNLQRSEDGTTFETIATLKAKGAEDKITEYNTTDSLPHNGLNYYRLEVHSLDGKVDYNRVISTHFGSEKVFDLSPTLAQNEVTLYLASPFRDDTQVCFFDASGRLFLTETLIAGESRQQIAVQNLPKGQYFVVLINNKGQKLKVKTIMKM